MSGSIEPGERVGPYLIEALLGMGGMGAVYRARDTRLGRRVALKVVRRDRDDKTGVAPEDRLIAEAQAVAALRHPHVVEVYDAGVSGGQTYVAMELVLGKPLRAYVDSGTASVPLATRKRWLLEVASALAAAHRAGIIHRDIKPENVIIDTDGAARVLDFGLAKRIADDEAAPTALTPQHQTLEGRVVGTVSYMAPEQLAGAPPDPKWDQFAWGVMAYEVLTGRHPRLAVPMPGQTAHLTQTPKMPNELAPEIAFSDAVAVMRARDPDPSRRFASMDAVIAALRADVELPAPPTRRPQEITASRPVAAASPTAPRRFPVLAAVLVAGVIGVAIGWAMSRRAAPAASAATASTAPASASLAVVASASAVSASATPVAPTAPSSSQAGAPRTGGMPEDYGTRCECNAAEQPRLCPRNANLRVRRCECSTKDGSSLAALDGGSGFIGRGLADGQPCQGEEGNGQVAPGVLEDCKFVCDEKGFAGLHRTACRGLNPHDGKELEGILFCY